VVVCDAHDEAASGVKVLEHQRGVGAAEAERVRQHAVSFALSMRLRTIGMSAKAGSSSVMCALSQMKPLFSISSE
jgi:hypothetical protein